MTTNLAFAPSLPIWVIVPLCVSAATVALLSILRAPRSAAPRLLALAGLAGLLFNPQIRRAETTPLDDIAILLIDESESQTLDDRLSATRAAADKLEADLERLSGVEVRRQTVLGAEETRLNAALAAAIGDTPRARLGAVFLVTDGRSSEPIDIEGLKTGAPVHALMSGRAGEVDRKVTLIDAPRYGVVNDRVDVSFRIDDVGRDEALIGAGAEVVAALRVDGAEILSQSVPVGREVSFKAPLPRPGETVIEISAAPLAGELTDRNNTAILRIAAIRDRLRVLLISGEPHAGERVWRNLLKSDPAIDLVHFTILRPVEKAMSDLALERELALIEFPQDELFIEKLGEFDLVIFDRYANRGVLNAYHFDNIARYVEAGGAVLVAAGPEFFGDLSLALQRNFAHLLPATPAGPAVETAFRPRISADGARHPVAADLPGAGAWGRWLRLMPVEPRRGRALIEGPSGEPLLILDRVGDGRVGLLVTDHVWLWARGFDGGGPHAEFLRRIAHWLMKEPELEEERLLIRSAPGALVVERWSLSDAPQPVVVSGPGGLSTELPFAPTGPGRFEARVADPPRGLYRAQSGDLYAIGEVGLAAPPEYKDVVSDRRPMREVAEATGGGVFDLRQGSAVTTPGIRRIDAAARQRAGRDWAGVVARKARRTDSIRETDLAPPGVFLAAILSGLLIAWLLESGRIGRQRPHSP